MLLFLRLIYFGFADVARALSSDWVELAEEIGLWIPVKIINKEHDDKPEGAEDLGNNLTFPFLCLKIKTHCFLLGTSNKLMNDELL